MKETPIGFTEYMIGALTILPWAFVVWKAYPEKKTVRLVSGILIALALGWISTEIITWLHPILWPETDFNPKKKVSMLTQTVHIAFIQAGIMEESVKILFLLFLTAALGYDYKEKKFQPQVVLFAAFIAMGFSLIENSLYIAREIPDKKIAIFIGRTIHSSNFHLLIDLCFALFMLKSNDKEKTDRITYLLLAFVLAVLQHGVVDFLLIPGATFGNWIATAMFVGIWVWIVRDWRIYVTAYLQERKTLIPASEYSSQSI